MLVLAAALQIARAVYLNSVPASVLPADAAAAAYDILVRFIKDGLRLLLVIGLIVAAGAYLAGPGTTAVRVRRGVWAGLDWIRVKSGHDGVPAGPVRRWTATHKTVLRAAAVAIVVLVFVFWGQPTLGLVIWLVVLLLIALGVIELIGGRTAPGGGTQAPPETAAATATAQTAAGQTAGTVPASAVPAQPTGPAEPAQPAKPAAPGTGSGKPT
jgi:hypothetical protein